MAQAPLPLSNAAGIVEQLRTATQRRDRTRAVQLCASLIGLNDMSDNVAAHRAGAASAVAEVLEAWPNDALVMQTALCALFHVWAGGVPPFDTTAVPTESILQAIVDSLRRHKSELYVTQAAVRLLKMHTASANRLLVLPAVMEAVEQSMESFPNDDTVQDWAARILCHIHAIPEDDIVQTHGQEACAIICTKTLKLADSALRPATVFIGKTPWYDAIVDILSPAVNSRQ